MQPFQGFLGAVDSAFSNALWNMYAKTGIRPEFLIPVLFSESGLNPAIQNFQGYPYYGINQINGTYLQRLGIDPSTYLTWSASQQLASVVTPYMQAQIAAFGPLRSGTRVYQANFLPAISQDRDVARQRARHADACVRLWPNRRRLLRQPRSRLHPQRHDHRQ